MFGLLTLPNVLALLDLILIIPVSSADAERGLNQVKRAVTDSRSKLTSTSLSDSVGVPCYAETIVQREMCGPI